MALRVWLPLTGTLENKGLLQFSATNNVGAVVNSSGKIGSCYSFNGSDQRIEFTHDKTIWNDKEISIAMWYKYSEGNTTCTMVDIAADLCLSYTYSSPNVRFNYWRAYSNNGTRTGDSGSGNYYDASVWHHVILTCDHNMNKIYVDGELDASFDRSSKYTTNWKPLLAAGYNKITLAKSAGSNPYGSGYLNDVRIYDHCLSAVEIKEIAQGLVLHYKLDDTYAEASTFLASGITTTTYNGSNGKYGYNDTSNLAKTNGIFQGKQCTKISTITAGQNAQPYSYFSNLFTSNGTNSPEYKALSFDYYTTCPTTTWLNIYKLGSGTGTATWKTTSATAGTRTGTYTNSSSSILVQPNEWNRVEVILHGTTDADAQWGYCINGPAHTSNANYYFLFANIQLEQNDHVTGQGQGLHNAIVQDSSGYGHNGTIVGDLILNAETKRYSTSIKWNSSDPTTNNETGICYIQTPITLTTPLQMSITWWAKPENGYGGGTGHGALCTSANTSRPTDYNTTAFHHRDSGFDIYPSDASGVKRLSFTYTKNEWHHYALTYDGTTARAYQDGVEKTTVTVGTNKTLATFTQLYIGYSQAGGVRRKTLGSYSDFRIYCTALSADDILALYHTGAKVDNLGSLHTFEFNENGSNKLTKTGILKNYAVEPFLTLADGSKWQLMLYHYVDGGNNLFTSSNATFCNDFGLYSRLAYINNFTYDSKYEFYVLQDDKQFRWTQTSQPTASSIAGLTTVSGYTNPVNGLAKASQSNTYIGYGAWWGACGCWTSYSTGGKIGIPGFGSHDANGICTTYLALYVRVNNFNAKIANLSSYANNLIEF